MRRLVLIALVGLVAQFIDGALGMAYGATTATLLLTVGIAPALASMIIHLAEVGTTAASGIAHHRFGNVDWRSVGWLAVPGGLGAIVGAYALVGMDASVARPWMAAFLVVLGLYILLRYSSGKVNSALSTRRLRRGYLVPLGLLAGFFDAAGGGGWGPLGTSSLLASGRIEPRKAIGTVDTSEFLVAVCASIGFLLALGSAEVPWAMVLALLVGGVIAAPLAAWFVRKIHPMLLGTLAGGVIALTNFRTILDVANVRGAAAVTALTTLAVGWLLLVALAVMRLRRERRVA